MLDGCSDAIRVAGALASFALTAAAAGQPGSDVPLQKERSRVASVEMPVDLNRVHDGQSAERAVRPGGHSPAGSSGNGPASRDIGLVTTSVLTVRASALEAFKRANIAVYNATGTVVASAGSTNPIFVIPAEVSVALPTGTYYIVTWEGTGTAENGFVAPAGNFSSLFNMDFLGGDIHSTNFQSNGRRNWYSVYVNRPTVDGSGATVSDLARFPLTTLGSNFNTQLALFDNSGNLLGSNDDADFFTAQSVIPNVQLSAGRYFAAVSVGANYGNRFLVDTIDTSSGGNFRLNAGSVLLTQGAVGTGQFEWSDFFVRAEGIGSDIGEVASSLQEININTFGSAIDTQLGVWNINTGELVASNNNFAGSMKSSLDATLPGGAYVIGVNGGTTQLSNGFVSVTFPGGPTGAFSLQVRQQGVPRVNLPSEVIDVSGDTDYYRFSIETPTDFGVVSTDEVTVDINTLMANFDTEICVFDASGGVVSSNDDTNGTLQSRVARVYEPGAYYLAVTGYNTVFGAGFRTEIDGSEATGLYQGGLGPVFLSGVTTPTNLVDWYRFEIADQGTPEEATDLGVISRDGQLINIGLANSNFDTTLGLFDATGTVLAIDNDFIGLTSRITVALPAGTYYFAVAGFPNFFGDGFVVESDPSAFGTIRGIAGPSGNVATFEDSIISRGSRFYRFTVAAVPCNPADVAEPFAVLDVDDVLTFLNAFSAGDSLADIAPPSGSLDIDDVLAFLAAFSAGCP